MAIIRNVRRFSKSVCVNLDNFFPIEPEQTAQTEQTEQPQPEQTAQTEQTEQPQPEQPAQIGQATKANAIAKKIACTMKKINIKKYITESSELIESFYREILDGGNSVLINAPTGAGKTKAIQIAAQRIIEEQKFRKVLIIAPTVAIGEQVALELDVTPINQNISTRGRKKAMEGGVIVATFNQVERVVRELGTAGITADELLIIVDEAHSLIETFRQKLMDSTFSILERAGKVVYLTATVPTGLTETIGIETILKYEVEDVIKKTITIHRNNSKEVLSFCIREYLDSNPDKLLKVFINSGAKIKEIISFLETDNVLKKDEIGVFAADELLEKNILSEYDVSSSIEKLQKVPAGIRVLFVTSVAEYGVNILNENVDTIFFWSSDNGGVKAHSVIQATARARRAKKMDVHIFLRAGKEADDGGFTFLEVLETEQRKLQFIKEDVNDRLSIYRRRNNATFENFENDIASEGYIKEGLTRCLGIDRIANQYKTLKFAALAASHDTFANWLGYNNLINEIIALDGNFGNSGRVVEYEVTRNKKKVFITPKLNGADTLEKVELEKTAFETGLLSKEDALKAFWQIYKQYEKSEFDLPFLVQILMIGVLWYKFELKDETLNIDGKDYDFFHGNLKDKQTEKIYKTLKNGGLIFERGNLDKFLNKALALVRRGFTERRAIELGIAFTLSENGAYKLFNYVFNNLLFKLARDEDATYDVLGRRNTETTRLTVSQLNALIKAQEGDAQGWEFERVYRFLTAAQSAKERVYNSVEVLRKNLAFVCNIKINRIKSGGKNGDRKQFYKIISIKNKEELYKPITKVIEDFTGEKFDAELFSKQLQVITHLLRIKSGFEVDISNLDMDEYNKARTGAIDLGAQSDCGNDDFDVPF